MIDVLIHNETDFETSEVMLTDTMQAICHDHGIQHGEVSLAIVADATIQRLNRDHLQHDYPTDVLSFLLERQGDTLEGEVIVSAETAVRAAAEYRWPSLHELLLYCIHGTLHLVGYEDLDEQQRAYMRDREAYYLQRAGIAVESFSNAHRLPARHAKKEASA